MRIEMLDVSKDTDGDVFIDIRLEDGNAIGILLDGKLKTYQGWTLSKDKSPAQDFEERPIREVNTQY